MIKKITANILSLLLFISLASSALGFESNANRVNPYFMYTTWRRPNKKRKPVFQL
jgi:hypothetical protein